MHARARSGEALLKDSASLRCVPRHRFYKRPQHPRTRRSMMPARHESPYRGVKGSLAADAALAAADEAHEATGVLRGNLMLYTGEGIVEFETRVVEQLISRLQMMNFLECEAGAFQANEVQPLGGDVEIGV